MILNLYFSPLLPLWFVVAFVGLGITLVVYQIIKKFPGGLARLASLLVLTVVALGPKVNQEEREFRDDIVAVIVDKTASQNIGTRTDQRNIALASLIKDSAKFPNLKLNIVNAENSHGKGSNLLAVLRESIKKIPNEQYAGAVLLTDGQVHDVSHVKQIPGPIHVLLSGKPGEYDRRIIIKNPTSYAIVGGTVKINYSVEEEPKSKKNKLSANQVPVTILVDGSIVENSLVTIGQLYDFDFKPNRVGLNIIEFRTATRKDEVSHINNQNYIGINAIRDRLRVLLISGKPHAGERTWRNLLKSDPAVELVHFTILRPPEKDDFTPLNELALISFPVHELFEEKIDSFDLIVFDRYLVRDVLPPAYIRNINNKVRRGGAVLLSVGPEFVGSRSLANTPLSEILPVMPTEKVHERSFKPSITKIGKRHPVTSDLVRGKEALPWGNWLRQIEVIPDDSKVLMQGLDGLPLLVVGQVGKGRVGLLASDHIWLWARGFQGGGPHEKLVKRLSHWLMREPDLEEEQLKGFIKEDKLIIERRSLSDEEIKLSITAPSGLTADKQNRPDLFGYTQFKIESPEIGVYRVHDGTNETLIPVGETNPVEFQHLRAGSEKLKPLIEKAGGSFHWLNDGGPMLRRVKAGRNQSGKDWIGFTKREAYVIKGFSEHHLFFGFPLALLVITLLGITWRREGT